MPDTEDGMTMTPLRSALFIPGNKERMLAKASGVNADAILPDMEDSVPDAEKANARTIISTFLPQLRDTSALIIPRVNALETGWIEKDLSAVVGPYIDGISVGKINTPSDITEVSTLMAKLERRAGLPVGQLRIIPWIETAQAIMNCYEIFLASTRIIAGAFGAEDFTNDLGVERLDDESQLLFARSRLCTAARAAGITALDTPYFRFRDDDGLRASSTAARHLGFKGRFAIHPAQVETINECFSPSAKEIEHARRVVAAFEEAEARGRGSTSLDGVVIDVPVVKRARAFLALVER
jgi:citrate lyase subunit beta/citryl-CoA lyase